MTFRKRGKVVGGFEVEGFGKANVHRYGDSRKR
jgi:hypothetical protein